MLRRKLLVALISLMMVFAFMPFASFAEDVIAGGGTGEQVTVDQPDTPPAQEDEGEVNNPDENTTDPANLGDPSEQVQPAPIEDPAKAPAKVASKKSGATASAKPVQPAYELTVVEGQQAPLAANSLTEGDCCLLHPILMLLALAAVIVYVVDMKRRQARIFELEHELGEDIDFTI